ncbi:MAG: hypothetical protein ACP5KB_04965, partial [Thermoprotei archaeon]
MTSLSGESLRASYVIPSIIEIKVEIVEGIDGKLRYRVHEPVLSDVGRTFLSTLIYEIYHDLNLLKTMSNYGFSRESHEKVVNLIRDRVRKSSSLRLGTLFKSSHSTSKIN